MNLVIVGVVTFFLLLTPLHAAKPAATEAPPGNRIQITPKTHVVITNNLGDGLRVSVHCKSKNDDLGVQNLYDGQAYEFIFNPNLSFTTLFFCSFSWEKGSLSVTVYHGSRDYVRCGKHCAWKVTKESVNGYNDAGRADLVYKWK